MKLFCKVSGSMPLKRSIIRNIEYSIVNAIKEGRLPLEREGELLKFPLKQVWFIRVDLSSGGTDCGWMGTDGHDFYTRERCTEVTWEELISRINKYTTLGITVTPPVSTYRSLKDLPLVPKGSLFIFNPTRQQYIGPSEITVRLSTIVKATDWFEPETEKVKHIFCNRAINTLRAHLIELDDKTLLKSSILSMLDVVDTTPGVNCITWNKLRLTSKRLHTLLELMKNAS